MRERAWLMNVTIRDLLFFLSSPCVWPRFLYLRCDTTTHEYLEGIGESLGQLFTCKSGGRVRFMVESGLDTRGVPRWGSYIQFSEVDLFVPRVLILSTDKTRELLPSNLSSWFSYFLVDLVLTCPGLYFSTPQEKAVCAWGASASSSGRILRIIVRA